MATSFLVCFTMNSRAMATRTPLNPELYQAIFRRRRTPRLVLRPAEPPAVHPQWNEFVNERALQPAAATLSRDLKAYLKGRLPDYMVPSAFVVMDAMPRTPNGKIDRKALPAPEQRQGQAAPAASPKTETERAIAAVWQRLLNIETVGLDDNFFDLGANSLTMVQANSILRDQLKCALSLVDLFRFPTVSALAAHLSAPTETVQETRSEVNGQTKGRRQLDAMLRRMHARQVASEEKGA